MVYVTEISARTSNFLSTTTGPKTSSFHRSSSKDTSSITVGG